MRKTAARPGRLFIHPSHNSFKLGCLRHRAMCSSSYRPVPDFPCRRVTVTLSYPIIYLTMFIDSFGFWTWRTLFCPIRLSPHRPKSMFLKLCLQPAFSKLFSRPALFKNTDIDFPLLQTARFPKSHPHHTLSSFLVK